jgi:hypothetical protein
MNSGKPYPPFPVLIVIPYWSGDKEVCRKMIDLMVDLEPEHVGRRAAVLLTHRQDEERVDKEMVLKLKTRFNLYTLRSTSPQRGWPSGCNGMFGSAMIHVHVWNIPCDCIYWMESDCTPMYRGWFDDLANAWARKKPMTLVMGWEGDCNHDGTGHHITGCALYDPHIAIKLSDITICDGVAWDYQYRKQIMAVGEKTLLIENAYKSKKATKRMMECGYAIVHGVKDGSLCDMVRRKYLTELPKQV